MMPDTPSTPIHQLAQPFHLPGGPIGVLLIHGYGGSIGDYRSVGEGLHRSGYTVYGLRLTGHGQDLRALRAAHVSNWQRDVRQAVTRLRQSCAQVVALGSSFGGILALDAAEQQLVDGIILVNTALQYRGGGPLQGVLLRLLRIITPYYHKRGLSAAEVAQGAAVGSSSAWPISGILETATFARSHVRPHLADVTVPCCIIQSADDPVVGVSGNDVLEHAISNNPERHILPQRTHRPFRDSGATQTIVEISTTFIQRRIAKAP